MLDDFLDRRALYELRQSDSLEKGENPIAELGPKLVRQTAPAFQAVFLARTTGCIQLLVDGADNVSNGYVLSATSQAISAPGTANPFDKGILAEFGEQLFQIGKGYALTSRNFGQRYGTDVIMDREIHHRGNGITTFRG
jgi:hypothetical protein